MAGREGSLIPQADDCRIGTSWFPMTPAKPNLPPIYWNWQKNQPGQINGVESQRIAQEQDLSQVKQIELKDFFQEPQAKRAAACCGSTNSATVTEYFDAREAAAGSESTMCGEKNIKMCNNVSTDDVDEWSNVSFGDLLALADAAGSTAATENANAQTNFTMNDSFSSLISSQDADGSSVCSRFPFNLNSPTRMTDEDLSSNNAFQFEPITPYQINKKGPASDAPSLDFNKTSIARHVKPSKDTLKRAEANDLQHNTKQLGLVLNISELPENRMIDKAVNQDAEQNNTTRQKRRKKHRPKVVIEGEHKRTPKPKTPQNHGSMRTRKEKRKYVQRNKIEEPPGTPSDEVYDMTRHEGHFPSSGKIQRAKRTNIRRNQVNKFSPNPAEEGTIDPPNVSHPRRFPRRSLNFDSESRLSDQNSSHWPSSTVEELHENQSNSSVHLGNGIEATTAKTALGSVYDFTYSHQELKTCQNHHEMSYPDPSTLKKIGLNRGKFAMNNQNEISRGKCKIVFSDETHDKQARILEMTPKNPNNSNCSSSSSSTWLIQKTPERVLKRRRSFRTDEPTLYRTNVRGAYSNSMQAYQAILPANEPYAQSTQGMHFPTIYKKKRTEKGHPLATSYIKTFTCETNSLSLSQSNIGLSQASTSANDNANNLMPNGELVLAFVEAEGLRRKRSKSISTVRDLASLLEICKHFPTHPVKAAKVSEFGEKYGISDQPNTCMEALVADTRAIMKTKKRSKRSILVSSTASHMHARPEFTTIARGSIPAITWRSPVDDIAKRLQHLDLNRESIHPYQSAENALVIYQRDGSIVPFAGSLVRKRRPRPKVDLDDETTRVWKLLLQDINSEGIDGTDEDKAKWWESEREVFHGRVDSFVARMRLVQGDRRFSPWKGSVVDSVVGVFLTQNVSDHLSSSAFMTLASRFPLKSDIGMEKNEERTGINVEEPEVSTLEPDDTIGWHDDQSAQPTPGQEFSRVSSAESDDEKTAVHSSESSENSTNCSGSTENYILQQPGSSRESSCVHHESTMYGSATANATKKFWGDPAEPDDFLSSQNSVLSSQDSANFSAIQTSEGTESSNFSGSASFLKLLRIAGTSKSHRVQDRKSENILLEKDIDSQLKHVACCLHFQKDGENLRGSIENDCPCSYLGSHTVSNSGEQQTKCKSNLEEAAKFSDLSRELDAPEQSKLSAEPANHVLYGEMSETYISHNNNQNKAYTATIDDPVVNIELQAQIEDSNYTMQRVAEAPTFSEASVDVREEVSLVVDSSKSEHTALVSDSNNRKNHAGSTLERANHNTTAKKERPGKEKQNVDWDSLRLQAQNNGKKRERTANTMDSLDWDAVRCADVNEIAYTIRERGMNNMLAERIKDFLNRVFREHGSIDLEWLRDVPPDKAKEYLLSIRGLGLKSVECVRLLTLHNLAFPVDTNVGRIAVRLGWVPLQPLPESLQLHLLELYPVLESIQKYLWPRLCKLDQRTLYELHYHMITFGKVFCSKSKPNCNACPMRGECRHFASAFASARLALPAPEEKNIVSATENKAAGQNPFQNFNQQPLPLLQANQTPLEYPKLINSAPVIEVPATPEPIVEVPATPEPEQEAPEIDIEDACFEDPNEIPTIELNMTQFTQNVKNFVQNNMELQQVEMSKALVALTPAAASIPTPKLKHISRLRTEHQVYELPDSHPLLEGFDKREPDDPSSYLLAIWTPGETSDSIQPPGRQCNSQETGILCDNETCFACNSIREAHAQTVRGTILIPCRTAMRGNFPLNGTYFQVNEVFADHDSSLKPIDVPRNWLWDLPRRTVYFGTSIPSIFKGLTTESIQHCFWRGFVCVRGFDKKIRAPRPLMARLHFPASKLSRTKEKPDEN